VPVLKVGFFFLGFFFAGTQVFKTFKELKV
jgi:hypothetical protein